MKKLICLAVSLMVTLSIAAFSNAHAAGDPSIPRQVSVHGNWGLYVYQDNGHKVCFITSKPTKSQGKYTKRGNVHTFITHWTEDSTKNVFNVATGYPYKTGSMVTVKIDGKKYTLATTKGETAWADDQSTDDALAVAIQKGSRMVIQGTSQRGTLTTDTYSLKGSGAAYKALEAACKI